MWPRARRAVRCLQTCACELARCARSPARRLCPHVCHPAYFLAAAAASWIGARLCPPSPITGPQTPTMKALKRLCFCAQQPASRTLKHRTAQHCNVRVQGLPRDGRRKPRAGELEGGSLDHLLVLPYPNLALPDLSCAGSAAGAADRDTRLPTPGPATPVPGVGHTALHAGAAAPASGSKEGGAASSPSSVGS